MLALATLLLKIRLVFLYLLIAFREATFTNGRHDLTKKLSVSVEFGKRRHVTLM